MEIFFYVCAGAVFGATARVVWEEYMTPWLKRKQAYKRRVASRRASRVARLQAKRNKQDCAH